MDTTSVSHIVITRPKDRASSLMDRLAKLTQQRSASAPLVKAYHCPLTHIEAYFEQPLPNTVEFDGVIFISGNAVLCAKDYFAFQQKQHNSSLNKTQNYWKTLLQSPLFAIGAQTASTLDKELVKVAVQNKVIFPQQMNSEGFLALDELASIAGQSWLIVKGIGGRPMLKKGLQQLGAKVSELEVYQRKLPDLIAQKQIESYNQLNPLWIVTSVQAVIHLDRILRQKTKSCRLIVSSDRIAKEATRLKFTICGQARDASDEQLIHCIQQVVNATN